MALATLVGTRQEAYNLVWRPKADQVLRYALSLDTMVDGSKTGYQAELAIQVVKVDTNGDYTVSTSYRGQKLTVDGKVQEIPDDSASKPQVEHFSARGVRLDAPQKTDDDGEADPLGKALGDLTEFSAPAKPVKAGDKWTKIIAGNARKNVSPAKIEYTVSGIETAGSAHTVKIAFAYNETQAEKPVHANGSIWIDSADGCFARLDATIANLRLEEGGGALGQAHLSLGRE